MSGIVAIVSFVLWAISVAGSALILTQSSITKPLRDWLIPTDADYVREGRVWRILGTLISCPMCSGFWLGLVWAFAFGSRGIVLVAYTFAGSIVAALAVAAWLALSEAQQALALWRYSNQPKDDAPESTLVRIPKYMRAGLSNTTFDEIKCACGERIGAGPGCWHIVTEDCYLLHAAGIRVLPGTVAGFTNMTINSAVCECGVIVISGQSHIIGPRCNGTTSLEL